MKNNRACCIAYPRGEPHREIVSKYVIAARGTSGVPDTADKIDYLCTNSGGGVATVEMLIDGKTEKGPKWLPSKTWLKRGWAVVLYHLVHHGRGAEEQNASAAKVEADVREMASHKDRLWIGRFEDVARYGQERDTAKLSCVLKGDKIAVSVTDDMKDDVFDFPLTVKVRLPDGCICERVNMSDWEGPGAVGGVYAFSCWCETSLILTDFELMRAHPELRE